jgi:UDP-N-acetylmuramoyl-L-alanyl-D-glutamate--2,6-diaminopimelate ligase
MEAVLRELAPRGLAWDSRRVRPGDLFFALPGQVHDGHRFIPQAIARGAVGVVGEQDLGPLAVPYFRVPDARAALALAAAAFYRHPTEKLVTIGVTGTDGKTTVVHLLGQLVENCATLTTVQVAKQELSCVTTPEAPDVQRVAAQALTAGARFFALEASSIGLAQKRLLGVRFKGAVFTNLTPEHLEFHGSLDSYLAAKLSLFEGLDPSGWGIVNEESPYSLHFLRASNARVLTYGVRAGEIRASAVRELDWGWAFQLITPAGRAPVSLPFPGRFNLENALGAASAAWALGVPIPQIADRLSRARLPPGRLERYLLPGGALAVVDYAHTPAALEAVVSLLRPRARRLVVVGGAPGGTPREERQQLGKLVGQVADLAILTTDNPKGDPPEEIARQLALGLEEARGSYELELDRKAAIRRAVQLAGPGDVVLVVGKGHERWQLTAQGREPHSDREALLELGAAKCPT